MRTVRRDADSIASKNSSVSQTDDWVQDGKSLDGELERKYTVDRRRNGRRHTATSLVLVATGKAVRTTNVWTRRPAINRSVRGHHRQIVDTVRNLRESCGTTEVGPMPAQ